MAQSVEGLGQLGVTARFWWTNVNDPEGLGEVTYNMVGLAALFSATYN